MTVAEILTGMNFDGRVLVRDSFGAVCGGDSDRVVSKVGDCLVLSSFVGFEGALVLKIKKSNYTV